MTPDAAVEAGIYNVPRNLMDDTRYSRTQEGQQFFIDGNPLDIYNYPRVSISPDEEGIYDDPLDIVDMEIYDYPPDASDLGLDYSNWNTTEFKRNTFSDYSQTHSSDLTVPPLPSSARPSIVGSVGSISDGNQVRRLFHVETIR